MDRIYLDNNATTCLDPRVHQAMTDALSQCMGNPSSVHWFGQQARAALTQARRQMARALGAKTPEIIFTSSGTECANMLMRGLLSPGDHFISSDLEHSCVFTTAHELDKLGVEVTLLHPGSQGSVDASMLRAAIQPNTKLILLTAVNTETGVKTDLEALAQVALEANVCFVVDGVGLLGREQFQVPEGVDAMFFSGHKIHAPKGVGVLYQRKRCKFPPFITGGSQEFNRRAGTENLPGIIAMGVAVEVLEEELPAASEHMRQLRDRFETALKERIPDLVVVGADLPRVVNTACIGFEGVDGESLLMHLDLQGLACSHGSACASGAVEPSRVLLNMDMPRQLAASTLRFSVSRFTKEADIDRAIDIISDVVLQLRKLSRS